MTIRTYKDDDFNAIADLFYETVHTVNAKDYSKKELDAWAPKINEHENLKRALKNNYSIVAEADNKIVGFADIDSTGYLDHLFIHKDYQRKGIAKALLKEAEKGHGELSVHASITALPFFLKMGYEIEKEQIVEIRGEKLKNYVMAKVLAK